MFNFTIVGKPGAKQRPIFSSLTRTARTPKKTVTLEAVIAMVARGVRQRRPMIEGPVEVLVVATFEPTPSWPKKRKAAALDGTIGHCMKPDADNIAKAVTDACNGILYADDSQIVDIRCIKRYGVEAMTTVSVRPADLEKLRDINND